MQQQRVCGRAFRGVWGGGGAPVGRGWGYDVRTDLQCHSSRLEPSLLFRKA